MSAGTFLEACSKIEVYCVLHATGITWHIPKYCQCYEFEVWLPHVAERI